MRARIRHVGQRVAVAPPNWQSRLMSLLANSRQEALTKIQFSGWAIIVSSLLIGGVAYNTGNNLVFIILAAILSIIILSGILSKFNLRRVETLSLDCPSVGDAAEPLTIRISSDLSDFKLPVFGIGCSVEIHRLNPNNLQPLQFAPHHTARIYFAQMPPGEISHKTITLPLLPRGIYRVAITRIRSAYPFGFFLKQAPAALEKTVIILPTTHSLDESQIPSLPTHGPQTLPKVGDGVDLLSIRDYHTGDPLRRIHWKASAKTGRFLVRELAREQSPIIILGFDTRAPRAGMTADYERAITSTASLCKWLWEKNCAVGLVTPTDSLPAAHHSFHMTRMLEFLAHLPAEPTDQVTHGSSPLPLPPGGILLTWTDTPGQNGYTQIDLRPLFKLPAEVSA